MTAVAPEASRPAAVLSVARDAAAPRTERPTRRRVVAAVLAAACISLAACGSPVTAAQRSAVRAVDLPGLGQVLATVGGYTLYVYVPDRRGRPRCVGVCAQAWPPLMLPAGTARPEAGPGIDDALLGTTTRRDGSVQVTYNGWPLYLDRSDRPGEASGQGDGMGAWYVMSVSGTVDRTTGTTGASR